MIRNWFGSLILVCLAAVYFYLLAVPINFATADLGRHIKNGESLLSGQLGLLYKNYYSYTYPDFPFVNHHWLGGIVFYLIWLVSGFIGVQLLFIIINLTTFTVFFHIAKKYSNIGICSIISILIIPILAYRNEVRPEVFSYLFAGVYYLVLKGFSEGWIKKKWLYGLIPLQLIWVNTHIYFFIGLLLLSIFWIEIILDWIVKRRKEDLWKIKPLTIVGFLLAGISFINPHFINGLLYPFQIFGNYGYRVLENQSVFFLESRINIPVLMYFKIVLGLLILSWIYKLFRVFKYKEYLSISSLIFTLVFSTLALLQIRNLALFGLFSLVIMTANFSAVKYTASKYLLIPVLAILFLIILVINPSYWENRAFGIGLAPNIEKASEFFTKDNIQGPIFNNYDIGGYLIYYLNPKEKVFVDNRPEGYPVGFFKDIYVPMQEDDAIWKSQNLKYQFNAIFFYRKDLTPWAQKFLISRIEDPDWAPVFVDNYNIIFLKRNEENKELIKKYELPKEMFRTK